MKIVQNYVGATARDKILLVMPLEFVLFVQYEVIESVRPWSWPYKVLFNSSPGRGKSWAPFIDSLSLRILSINHAAHKGFWKW